VAEWRDAVSASVGGCTRGRGRAEGAALPKQLVLLAATEGP
jgi:hypothetical protein